MNEYVYIPEHLDIRNYYETISKLIKYYKDKNEFLNRIIDNGQIAMIIWTLEGKIVWLNKYAGKITSLKENPRGDLMNISSIIPPNIVISIKDKLVNSEDQKLHYKYCKQVTIIEGREIYLKWDNYSVRDEDGEEYIISTGTEISNFKSVQKQKDIVKRGLEKKGKKNIQYFKNKMNREIKTYNSIERDLKNSIINEELFLCYQPLIDTRTQKVRSLEALIRWNYLGKKVISPAEFIPIAEKSGVIIPIGEWVLINAFKQFKEWQKSGFTDLKLSVNVSVVQLQNPGFADIVSRILLETDLSPECIELEITESAHIGSVYNLLKNIGLLRRKGVKFSIDDFGTGYNSLKFIQKLKANSIKIDRTFIGNIKSDVNKIIINSIISLGHRINAVIIAEGVETKEQYEYLKEQGCDIIQGYYFSKPLLPEEATEFLKSNRHK